MNKFNPQDVIAHRTVLCLDAGGRKFDVRFYICKPRPTTSLEAPKLADGVVHTCEVIVDGIDEPNVKYFGVDGVHALNLASDLEPLLKRLSERFSFFWLSGEPYFD